VDVSWQLTELWNRLADRLPPQLSPDPKWSRLTMAWHTRYPECRPVAHELRGYTDLWVRFHCLPGSKRCPESGADYAELLRRHHAALNALAPGGGELLVVTVSRNQSRFPRRRPRKLARVAPEATLWRSLLYETDEFGELWWHLFVHTVASHKELDPLLRLVADDETAGVIITAPDLRWLYHPYDGGADLIAPSTGERDVLASRFADWLSDHPLGL
jgi:hypothetical protein